MSANMSEEEFLLSLPSDPEEAFPKYEAQVRKECVEIDIQGNYYLNVVRYLSKIVAYAEEHDIDVGFSEDEIVSIKENNDFEFIETKITVLTTKMNIRASIKQKQNIKPVYVLSPALKEKIHHHLGIIREDLNGLELTNLKKQDLLNKLNAFSKSVDQDKTSLEIAGSLYVSLKKDAAACADKIIDIIGMFKNAEEYTPYLIEKEKRKLLEAPVKKIADKSDKTSNGDEIPF